jgi:predicted P-loop ATPase
MRKPEQGLAPARAENVSLSHLAKEGLDAMTSSTQRTNKQEPPIGDEAVNFLKKLRPGGPWLLIAIDPSKNQNNITAITATTPDQVRAFITKHNGTRNLYYSLNPTRRPMNKKPEKLDLAAIEYLPSDLDPKSNETPDAAKARYLAAIKPMTPQPAAIIDSGNGLNLLFKLVKPILLDEPITVMASGERMFSPATEQMIAEAEGRAKALMELLGSVAGTQNIDRILRLPGTINLPTKAKLKKGRTICTSSLIAFNGATCTLEDFPEPTISWDDFAADANKAQGASASAKDKPDSQADQLDQVINDANAFGGDRSKAVWYVCHEMLRRGYPDAEIISVLIDKALPISAHIYDQGGKPKEVARRQLGRAKADLDFARNEKGKVVPTVANINVALVKLNVRTRYNEFADRTLIDGLEGFGPELSDAAIDHLWATLSLRFHFQPHKDLLQTVLGVNAHRAKFHPVCDYLDDVQPRWDGKPRVDRWLVRYAGAEDTAYVRAVSALPLIAAVRRVRQPGCKFDEALILQSPQGTDKSSALAIMAVHEDWFTDSLPLHGDSKEIIQATRGRWLIELSDLAGLRKADIDHVKALLSRRADRARMAWGRLVIEVLRQWIAFGTTNKEMIFRDTTGNRRFWPVNVKRFKLDELKRDVDQIWAEAATREAQGDRIRLAPELWPIAAEEQAKRLADDPFVSILEKYLGGLEGKIRTADIWMILNISGGQLHQEHNSRMSEAMKRIGWERPKSGKQLRFAGVKQSAYTRGSKNVEIMVSRVGGDLQVHESNDLFTMEKDD